tara:strand:+ start:922 stop:1197 length:276 start_codon:yes stop_codon:yes gene_type:complete
MNPFQITMLGLAAVLVVSLVWTPVKDLLKKTVGVIKLPKKTKVYDKDSSLVEIIGCWENLKQSCDDRGLSKASVELDKIFPLFVQKGGKNV